ncbi:4-hydroxythreonine-4-phosphate dehydrogenase [Emticicia oligotrophica DSM 17448]|uniref:4-hydroxythreonine-4-phosphate dehydrogenase n=1 Tax=Emticicia oligotrophica (strain DSM 17448 / CIP 109782 / MTCC 6937 / GPTSA100-15) TaxID=929562 RepID=A0ABM5N6E4_EMTOG|nr:MULTISPECIES: 4-hydroxythreonine-4-phosphate dehydrogenase PdxA [Emticicia]AFK05023.1 4-hydroxythreonine-4-phosphate dehydrogenase [Emticicia oligotrophica DSM 17448]
MSENKKPIIGISIGDFNGIGPEVIIKAVGSNRINKICTPVIYGSSKIINRYRQLLEMKDWQFFTIHKIEQINHKQVNVINCMNDQALEVQPGIVSPEAGKLAFEALKKAVEDLKNGKIDALVTAPINKHNIQSDEFKFPGHTEFLANAFEVKDELMFMVSENLKIGVATAHIPLEQVKSALNKELIINKIAQIKSSLIKDFGIQKPKIAVLGLNPHAGENGLLGNEENEVIIPAISECKKKGDLVVGPFPADGFFGTSAWKNYDAVLAMYHDQGLMPFKMIAFENGVNFTAGLPKVRTSPDHGTAYDIAGKNQADESSMLHAIYTAIDITRNREELDSLEANSLKKKNIVLKEASMED